MITLEQYIDESLKYDRAASRMQVIIADLFERRRDDKRFDLQNDNTPDVAYDVIINDLKNLQKGYREESDRLWAKVEMYKGVHRKAWEDLANAVIKMAVEDYERAISGNKDDNEKMLIEKFAENCDDGHMDLSKLKITAILQRVKRNHEKFVEYVHANAQGIIAETARLRSNHKEPRNGRYRCPNCDGTLYETVMYGVHRANCTGCFLSEIIKIDEKKKL